MAWEIEGCRDRRVIFIRGAIFAILWIRIALRRVVKKQALRGKCKSNLIENLKKQWSNVS